MKCFYINLDAAAERRRSLEENFARRRKDNWSLTRIPAVDAHYVDTHDIPGSSTSTEKACFLSHKKAIRESIGADEPVLILEDDAVFGENTCSVIDRFPSHSAGGAWDMIFTDVIVTSVKDMVRLVRLRQHLVAKNEVTIVDLKRIRFAGSTSYIVNNKSGKRLYDILEGYRNIDLPYDLFLRGKIRSAEISCLVFFPFITSVSEYSQASTVQRSPMRADVIWELFRKMVWMERDAAQYQSALDEIARGLGKEEKEFAVLVAAQMARSFETK